MSVNVCNNGHLDDDRRHWAASKSPAEHLAARYADIKTRADAASALLGMGLSIAAKFVLDHDGEWPSLRQARVWQQRALHV